MDSFYCNDSMCDEIEKVLVEDDEGLSKTAHEIHLTLLNIDLRANWFLSTVNLNQSDFTKFKKKILDSLNEYQQKTMSMKVLLVKLKDKDKELRDQMKDKDAEVEQLKTELISQKEESEKLAQELEETREVNHDLKTQLEEAKRAEEILKSQLEEKEETVQKLEMEVVGLREKGKKHEALVKLQDSSIVLDKILDCQRSPLDKTGLGYKKNKEKLEDESWSLKTPVAGTSTSKAAPQAPAQDNKEIGSSKMKQGVRSVHQSNFRKETAPRPRYESGFNGYCYYCSNFGHKAMDCRRRAGSPNVSVRCWTCNQVGHVAATCRTVRCYSCSGFGHKAHECARQRSQPRRNTPYTSERRFEDQKTNAYSQGYAQAWRNEGDQRSIGSSNSSVRCWSCNKFGHKAQNCWNDMRRLTYSSAKKTSKDNEGTDAQRTDDKKHVWMRKTEQLQKGEAYQSREDGCHMASQV